MGLMSKYVIEVYALSGVVVRANDFRKDLRLVGYSYYSRIEFNVVVGIKGDSMDRYLVRMNESLESVKTLNKCIRTLTTWYLSYTFGILIPEPYCSSRLILYCSLLPIPYRSIAR